MKVAPSYVGYSFDESKAYEKSGKLYVHATCKCDRCTKGVYVSRVENGQIVPHPAYNGVCLKCNGTGVLVKEVRLYTDKEYEKMVENNAKAQAKKKEEREAQLMAEAAAKREKWLNQEGFSQDGITYVYAEPDSYDVKETLKSLGFRFNKSLLWHIAEVPAGYDEKVVRVELKDVVTMGAWGTGTYNPDAQYYVQGLLKARIPASTSNYIEPVDGKISNLCVTCVGKRYIDSFYGTSLLLTFEDEEGNILTWFTKSEPAVEKGEGVILTGTFKKHEEYNGVKQTVITRVKFD